MLHYFDERVTTSDELDVCSVAGMMLGRQHTRLFRELLAQRGRQRSNLSRTKRLEQIVVRTERGRIQRADGRAMAGHQDNFRFRQLFLESTQY